MHKITFNVLAICTLLLFTNKIQAQFYQLGQDLYGEAAYDFFSSSLDITPDGQFLVVGASNNSNTASNAGNTRVFHFMSGSWIQIGSDINGIADSDLQGSSVAISDDGQTIVIGAYQNDNGENNAGSVYVYNFDGTNWVQLGSTISGTLSSENRGKHVDISGDGSIISTSDAGNKVGVNFYQYNGTDWVAYGNDITVNDMYYTIDLSSDGNSLIIGDNYGNGNNGYGSGFVQVYTNIAGVWTLKGDTIWGDAAFDHLGTSVAINNDGSQIIISATNNDSTANNAGQVKVFNFNGTNWTQKGNDLYGFNDSDLFGSSVDISNNGNTIAVGATNNDESYDNAGQVCVYAFSSGMWEQTGGNLNGEANGDQSGSAVSISATGDTIAIAAKYNDDAANTAGQVRVYTNCNSSNSLNISACDNYTSPSGNYTWNTSGIYYDTIPNSSGCDSLLIIDLTITHSTIGVDTQTACDSYTWIDGNTYTSNNNTATYTLTNSTGCDSVVTLDLTITHSTTGVDTQTACNSYTWIDGNTYTSDNNTATYTLTNSTGCDSVVTLDLTITTVNTDVTQNNDTLIAQAQGVAYQWLDCNDNYSQIQTANTMLFVPENSGDYAVQINDNGCIDTSTCYNVIVTNINNLEDNTIEIYPNPTKQFVNIIIPNSISVNEISIFDIAGTEVFTGKNISSNNLIDVSKFQTGTYFIRIISKENTINRKLIIK